MKFRFVFVMISFLLVACSQVENEKVAAEPVEAQQLEPANNTLRELAIYNESFAIQQTDRPITRGFWSDLWTIIKSDLVGAGIGAYKGLLRSISFPFGFMFSHKAIITHALAGGFIYSSHAFQEVYCDDNQADDSVSFSRLKVISEESIFDDVPIIIQSAVDTSLIALPDSLQDILKVGLAHNKLMQEWLNDISASGNTQGVISPILDDDYESNDVSDFLNSRDFSRYYHALEIEISDYCSIAGFDYDSFMEDEPFDSENVAQTIDLFVQAAESNVTSLNSLITMVNGYINIIETNNEFSYEEKMQIYSSLVVAIYSYSLWTNYLGS